MSDVDKQTSKQIRKQNVHLYSRLSLSRSPRVSLKYFVISEPRHIRFAELRKKIEQPHLTNVYVIGLLKLEIRSYVENIVEMRRNCSLGAIFPLFHNILLPSIRVSC